jgi:acyl-coenzyme A thioesterase PaaI-like protein
MCFVCGVKNSFGLKASFYETDGNELIALFVPAQEHQGYPGRLHGGIASSILDETIGRVVMIDNEEEIWGLTVELHVEYKKPIPLETELKVVARITEENSRFFKGAGEIVLPGGDVAVVARGRYLKVPLAKIAACSPAELEWTVLPNSNDPEHIEL